MGCPADRLEGVLSSLREENAALGRTLERASQLVAIPWESSNVGGLPLFFSVLPGVPRELVTVASRRWSDDNPDALVLLLMPEAEAGGILPVLGEGRTVTSVLPERVPTLAAKGAGDPTGSTARLLHEAGEQGGHRSFPFDIKRHGGRHDRPRSIFLHAALFTSGVHADFR